MKKIILMIVMVLGTITITGCGKEESVELDLIKVSSEIDSLSTGSIYIQGIDVSTIEKFEDITVEYDLEVFDLNINDLSAYSLNYNKKSGELLVVIKAVEGSEEVVEEAMDSFVKKMDNVDKYTEDDILIYIASSNNEEVLNIVKNTNEPLFGSLMEFTDEELESMLSIDPSDIEEYVVKVPMMSADSKMYAIIKPVEGSEDKVKEAMDKYFTSLEENTMYPENVELIKNRKESTVGDYLVYIVSSDNDLVFNTIK